MQSDLIAALDVGKTNTRLTLSNADTGQEIWSQQRRNQSVEQAGLRQLDVQAIERWLLQTLAATPGKDRISCIVPVAHGAAAVLVDSTGAVLAAPDYEDPRFDTLAGEYAQRRDDFSLTGSPELPLGLNLGRQLFFLERTHPLLFSRTEHILLYPQYWAWRLSDVPARELTSLGCHTDLWYPRSLSFSGLALNREWSALFPPLRAASDTLGRISPRVAAATGLNPLCRVVCGVHDSNLSWLQYLLDRREQKFVVVSSGTWTVVMANGPTSARMDPGRDMLTNVDVFGSPVATARFMGGREYEALAAGAGTPCVAGLETVVQKGMMALPSFAAGGPFGGHTGSTTVATAGLQPSDRAALATSYVALMTDLLVDMLAPDIPDLFVDGPFAGNPVYVGLLATLRPGARVCVEAQADGRTRALQYLAGYPVSARQPAKIVSPLELAALHSHRAAWRARLPGSAH